MPFDNPAYGAGRAYKKRRGVPKKKQAGFMYGQACGERTRGGGSCKLTLGHSGGHRA